MQDGGFVVETYVNPETRSEMKIPHMGNVPSWPVPPGFMLKSEITDQLIAADPPAPGGLEAVEGDEIGDIPGWDKDPVDFAIDDLNAQLERGVPPDQLDLTDAMSKHQVTQSQIHSRLAQTQTLLSVLPGVITANPVLKLAWTFMTNFLTPGLTPDMVGRGVTDEGPGGPHGLGSDPGDYGDVTSGLDTAVEAADAPSDESDAPGGPGSPGSSEGVSGGTGGDPFARGGLVRPMYDGGLVSMQDGGDTRDSISKFLSRRHGSGLIREPGPELPKPKPTRTKSKAPKLPPPKPKTATRTTPELPKPKPKPPTRAESKAPKPKFKSTPEYDKMLAKVKQDLKDVIPYIKDNYLAQLGLELLPPERIIHLSNAYTTAGWYAPRDISYDKPGRGYKFTSRELENLGINPADILEDEEGNRLNVLTYGGIKPNRTESELSSVDTRKLKNPWEFESEKIGRNLTKEERQVRKLSTLAHELTHVGDVAISRFLGPDDDIEMDKDLGELYTRLLDIRNRDRGLGKFSTHAPYESKAVWSGVKPRYPGDPFSTSVRKPKSPTNKRRLERLDPEDFEKAILNHPAQDAAKRMLESIRKRKQNKPMYAGGPVSMQDGGDPEEDPRDKSDTDISQVPSLPIEGEDVPSVASVVGKGIKKIPVLGTALSLLDPTPVADATLTGTGKEVYHLTTVPEITGGKLNVIPTEAASSKGIDSKSDIGVHVTTKKGVENYKELLKKLPGHPDHKKESNIFSFMAKIDNTIEIPDIDSFKSPESWIRNLTAKGGMFPDRLEGELIDKEYFIDVKDPKIRQMFSSRLYPSKSAIENLKSSVNGDEEQAVRLWKYLVEGSIKHSILKPDTERWVEFLKDFLDRTGADAFSYTNTKETGGEKSFMVLDQDKLLTSPIKAAQEYKLPVIPKSSFIKQFGNPSSLIKKESIGRLLKEHPNILLDSDGFPVLLFRGVRLAGHSPEGIENILKGKPRPVNTAFPESSRPWATFLSDNPYLAATYSGPDSEKINTPNQPWRHDVSLRRQATIIPFFIKADKIIEFPVEVTRSGEKLFSPMDFDEAASKLKPGEVLVARDVNDTGPYANIDLDPDRKWSFGHNQYAVRHEEQLINAIAEKKKGGQVRPMYDGGLV